MHSLIVLSVATVVALLTSAVVIRLKLWVVKRLGEHSGREGLSDTPRRAVHAAISSTSSFVIVGCSILLAALLVHTPYLPQSTIGKILVALLIAQLALWITIVLRTIIANSFSSGNGGQQSAASTIVQFLALVAIWAIALLVVLDNFGVNITALIAGLGVGGIAVALATQNILSDLFASLSIVLDKPFEPGDFIVVGESLGVVEHVGLKTTRLRSLSGEQIVISNSDLLQSRIRNYKRMFERRALFRFGITYNTPPELVERIPEWIRSIIENQSDTRFDRAHFVTFGESSLDFEVVYFVKDSEMNLYLDRQQAINLAIMKRFAEEKIEFAFPTRVVQLVRG